MKSPVTKTFDQRLAAFSADRAGLLAGGLKGIEKEALRIDPDGYLSRRPHPVGLGSALTNRYITTDFSEALLEFVTPAFHKTWEALRCLCDLHQFTYSNIDDELLWAASMPCRLPNDDEIPLARYGTSNVGQMKTIYRRGLGLRYGRRMQTIAGVHFNYSLPVDFWPWYEDACNASETVDEFRSSQYLSMVRNFRRVGWLVLYLFGASPAMCKSFGRGADIQLPSLNADTWYEPFGTSLRMSDLGYSNQNQSRINISLNNMDEYIRDLGEAIRTPEPAYEKYGVRDGDAYRQLSANRLQIENEFYSPIRPKRAARSGERPTAALRRGGVEYVEIRSLDISVTDPAGINQNTMRFIEAFLIYCLLEDSPPLDEMGTEETKLNQTGVAKRGRDPSLLLLRNGAEISLKQWAYEILDKVNDVAELIDGSEGGSSYAQAVHLMRSMVDEPDATPSARVLAEIAEYDNSFFQYAMSVARNHKAYFSATEPLSADRQQAFEDEATQSLRKQREIESSDRISFDRYLQNYFDAA